MGQRVAMTSSSGYNWVAVTPCSGCNLLKRTAAWMVGYGWSVCVDWTKDRDALACSSHPTTEGSISTASVSVRLALRMQLWIQACFMLPRDVQIVQSCSVTVNLTLEWHRRIVAHPHGVASRAKLCQCPNRFRWDRHLLVQNIEPSVEAKRSPVPHPA